MLVNTLQQQFETIYHVTQELSIEDFLINQDTLAHLKEKQLPLQSSSHQKGLMLLFPEGDELHVALYINDQVINNLRIYNPLLGLHEKNIHDFCIMVEEVSHFLYTTWKARQDMQMTRLEIELQGEIDKFILCTFYGSNSQVRTDRLPLKELLFETFRFEEDLPQEWIQRYTIASKLARNYCHFLENQFIKKNLLPQMIEEIRQFYRFSQTEKISHINRTAFNH
jgi:hypothetical protein